MGTNGLRVKLNSRGLPLEVLFVDFFDSGG